LTHSPGKPSPGWFSDPRHFREDAARNRKDNGPANIAILRRRAAGVARRDTSRGSLSIKLKRAGWSDAFLLSLLNQLAGA